MIVRSPARVVSPSSATENLLVGDEPERRSRSRYPVLLLATVPVSKEPVVSWALVTLKKLVEVVLPVTLTWPVPSGAIEMLPELPVVVVRERAGALIAKVPLTAVMRGDCSPMMISP